jgi:hypothetical protein
VDLDVVEDAQGVPIEPVHAEGPNRASRQVVQAVRCAAVGIALQRVVASRSSAVPTRPSALSVIDRPEPPQAIQFERAAEATEASVPFALRIVRPKPAQRFVTCVPLVPLQFDTAETRYGIDPADNVTPERSFERRWALTLLEDVLKRLQAEYEAEGKAALFAALNPCLVGERTSQPYAELATQHGMKEGAVKSAVHRLRQRYRQLLRDEIAQTVADPTEVDEELRHLFAALAGA